MRGRGELARAEARLPLRGFASLSSSAALRTPPPPRPPRREFVEELGRLQGGGGGSSSKAQLGTYFRIWREEVRPGCFNSRIEKQSFGV